MKTFKIIIGLLLLMGMGTEYVQASIHLGSLFSPEIMLAALTMLIFSTWLIGSEFSVRKFRFKSFEFVKFFMISFVIFMVAVVFGFRTEAKPSHYVHVNGLDIPIGECIKGHKSILPNKNEREKYCECLVEKITDDVALKLKYQQQLVENNIVAVIRDIESSPDFLGIDIQACTNSIDVEWNDNIANAMKESIKKELVGTVIEETNDIDQYCNCLLNAYQKIPLSKIISEGFYESTEALEIDENCIRQSENK